MSGALLFLIMVGEPAIGAKTGLYTVPGFCILFGLYLCYFTCLDVLVYRYQLNRIQLVFLTFITYSFLITGLLHGELLEYVHRPQDWLVITMIRIQCSFYTIFAYELLNKLFRTTKRPKNTALPFVFFIVFVLLLTPTKTFGIFQVISVIKDASLPFVIFSLLAIGAFVAMRSDKFSSTRVLPVKSMMKVSICLFILACVPSLPTFLVLLIAMPMSGCILLSNKNNRLARVVGRYL